MIPNFHKPAAAYNGFQGMVPLKGVCADGSNAVRQGYGRYVAKFSKAVIPNGCNPFVYCDGSDGTAGTLPGHAACAAQFPCPGDNQLIGNWLRIRFSFRENSIVRIFYKVPAKRTCLFPASSGKRCYRIFLFRSLHLPQGGKSKRRRGKRAQCK